MTAHGDSGVWRAVGVIALGLALAVGGPSGRGRAVPMPDSFSPLVERVKPAVVTIATTELQPSSDEGAVPQPPTVPHGSPLEKFFNDRLRRHRPPPPVQRLTALGSGFIIDPSGLVVTNDHVVANGTDIRVTLHDGTSLPATLLGHDEQTDLALLKIEAGHPLTAVAFGDSDSAKVGDWVIAVGNPFGLGGTVTAGIISARERDIHSGPADDYLQIDASINQGNSGGPTFDVNGRVIGINTAIFSPNGGSVGIGFAIPANAAKPVIAQLRATGKVTRGWLGVQIQSVTPELAEALGLERPRGALVSEVSPKSPAAAAGLQVGDVILAHDGKPFGELRELTMAVAGSPIGGRVTLKIEREGKAADLPVTIAEPPPDEPASPHPTAKPPTVLGGATGLRLSALTQSVRQRFGISNQIQGVLVTAVAESSAAAELGLQPGDIIELVNGRKVSAPKDVTGAVVGAGKSGRKAVALLVNRQGQKEFVALPVANG
ncbi:MAG: Do family serine endopeptidase [Pseudomonadota bacterium]